MLFDFGEFELDDALFELRSQGKPIAVQPKVLTLLLHLVRHRERVVRKEELFQLLWPAETVTETSLTRVVRLARVALSDSGDSQQIVRTVRGRGYRFMLPVLERRAPGRSMLASGPGAGEVSATRPATPPSWRPDGVFVGREAVLGVLEQHLGDAATGHGRLVLLVGEPGIGKTRTTQELATRAKTHGFEVLFGRCIEGDGAPAYWPWVCALRQCIAIRGAARVQAAMERGAADIVQAIPELGSAFSELPPPPAIDSSQARFRFFDSIARFLERASAEQPLLLVLDDLQRADPPSLRLLQFLSNELAAAHVLVLGACRRADATQDPSVVKLLQELARQYLSRCVELQGLTRSEVASYLQQTIGSAVSDGVLDTLLDQTGGNPLFLTQLTSLWHARGAAPGEDPRAGLEHAKSAPLLQQAIQRRLESLPESCSRVLRVAAVIGREFSLAVLSSVTEIEPARLLEMLDAALRAGVIHELFAASHYRFVHGLLPDALYEQLALPERAELHQRVGMALERRYTAHAGPHVAELAHHFLHAAALGNVGRAVEYALLAARRAMNQLAPEEAVLRYERALEALALDAPGSEGARVMEVMAEKAEALRLAGEPEAARAELQQVASMARRLGSTDGLLRAAIGIATPWESGLVDIERVRLLEESLEAVRADHPQRPLLLALLAKALYYAEQPERRTALVREAIDGARKLGHPVLLGHVLRLGHYALAEPELLDERMSLGDELVALARGARNDELLLLGYMGRVQDHLESGDMQAVYSTAASLSALAEEIRQPYFRALGRKYAAVRANVCGQLDEAERYATEAFEMRKRFDEHAYHVYCIQVIPILRSQARFAEAEALLRDISTRFPKMIGWRAALACMQFRDGRQEEARHQFVRIMAREFAPALREPHVLSSVVPLAELCALVGTEAEARALYQALRPYAPYHAIVSIGLLTHGPMARYLALVATRMRRFDLAAEHFEAAIASGDKQGYVRYVAGACCEYAEMLVLRAGPSDKQRAETLLKRSRGLARAHGLKEQEQLSGEAEHAMARVRSLQRVDL